MECKSVLKLSTLALALCVGLAAAAEDADKAAAPKQAPTPDAGATGQSNCIEQTGGYQTQGKAFTFVIGLENKCDKRLRCEVFAYVVGAKGPSSGRTIMILGPRSSGTAAKKTYAMKVKAPGGTAQVSRECRVF